MSKKTQWVLVVVMLSVISGCDMEFEQPTDSVLAKQTEKSMSEANKQIGMPAIVNFQERKLAKTIFELRDKENVTTYAYIVNHMTGELVFLGKCIGFGLPYSVQYTNPEKIAESGHNYGYAILPQADPNGLFMPTGLSATWLMMIDPETNEPRPVYVEPEILVSPFPLHNGSSENISNK
jgi:hypothetical protein